MHDGFIVCLLGEDEGYRTLSFQLYLFVYFFFHR